MPVGLEDAIIHCPFTSISRATPIWIINEITYYFTKLPQHFIGEPNGDLLITLVDVSLNQTTFVCIVPFNNEELTSDIIVLTVTGKASVY